MKVVLTFINLLLLFIIIKCDEEDQKYYFQLYPSQDKDKPYLLYAYTPPSNLITINTTEKDNCTIIDNTKISESAIKNLSSVIIYKNDLVIKTCFNPDILVEIKNATTNKKKSKILSNVKYCYSTAIYSPNIKNNQIKYAIITYWIEYELKNGKEIYTHKCILYDINSKTFSEEIFLKTTKNFYSEKCINLRNTDIFCSISSDEFTSVNYFAIETKKLFTNDNNHLVSSNLAIDRDVYQKIMATNLGLYDRLREYFYDIFIIEYHNKKKNITKLNFRLYKKGENKTMSFKDANFKSGELYIEQAYIEPNLFNMLFQRSNDSIVAYIMKAGNKNNYVLSRFNLTKSTENKQSTQVISNYLREDICSNPKYMQSSFMTTFIDYNPIEQSKINNGEKDYYKYQKDLVSLITCLNKDNKVEYEPKKIVLPQCLNILDELNDKNYHVIEFTPDRDRVVFDISNELKYRSLKNIDIQFLSPEITDKIIINYKKTNTDKFKAFGRNQFNEILSSISEIAFIKTSKMKLNEPLTLYYRLTQSGKSHDGNGISCHLSSDKCELKFEFKEETNIVVGPGVPPGVTQDPPDPVYICTVLHCEYCDKSICQKCENDIEGIILNKDLNKCICDVRKGFKEEPDETNKMCVCKEGYSYYKNIKQCLPNYYLKECKCFKRNEDLSLIPIYDDCPKDKTILEVDGKCVIIDESLCFDMNNLDMNLWFKLEEYKFYYAKINECVYIFDSKNLTLFFYSNREDCSFESDIMIRFIRNCLNKPEITGVKEYMDFLDSAKEYDPNATNITIFKKIEKKDSKIKTIHFNLVNGQSQENVSDVILPDHIISQIKNISNISEELNLLVFKADMTRNDTVSIQVEYQFYNPTPSKIHQKIIFKKRLNNTNLRRLDNDDDDDEDSGLGIHIKTDDFEVKLNLPIQWSNDELEIIEDLYKERHIFIFNSSNPFYLDVCYKFTTSYNADIYLQDRKEKYYINHPFCEEGCKLIDDNNYNSGKLTCQCSLKEVNDNYTNISFYEIEPDEEFKKVYSLPNVKVMGCIGEIFYEQSILKSAIFYVNFAIVVAYIFFYCFKRIICKKNDPFKEIINTIEKELSNFKTEYLDLDPEEEKEENENNDENSKKDEEHNVDQDKYEAEKNREEELAKYYDDDYDELNPLNSEKNNQNKEKKEENIPKESNKNPIKNLPKGENKNESGNNVLILKNNKNPEKDKVKEKDKNNDLIDNNDNNDSQKKGNEKEINNDLIDNDNNDSKKKDNEKKINNNLIDNDNNDSQKKDNEKEINNDLIYTDNNDSQKKNNEKEINNDLIDNNDNNDSQKKDNEKENNNDLIDNDNNDSQKKDNEKEINNDLIDNNDNNDSQKKDNEKEINGDLIQGDQKNKEEKSFMKKREENAYDKDSNKDISRFDPSNFIDKESENDSISRNSNPNKNNPLFKSKYEEEKSLDYINITVNNEDDKNIQKNANPPKKKESKSTNIAIPDKQNENSKDKNTSVNDNNNIMSNIFQNADKSSEDTHKDLYKQYDDDPKKSKLIEHYIVQKRIYSEEVIDRVDYDEALELEKDLAKTEKSSTGKEEARSFCQMFKRMILNNNTILFVFKCHDKNDCYTKIVVGILSACLYIFVNILIMIKGPSLHLYLRKDKGKFNCLSFFVNLLLPYVIFYFSILKLKKDLSIEGFLNKKYFTLYKILCDFTIDKKKIKKSKNNNIKEKDEDTVIISFQNKKNEEEKEKPKKKKNKSAENYEILNELRLQIHNLEAKISKKRNENQKETLKLFYGGLILILLNWYYMICFLGIYENSYDCLAMNILMSVISSLIVSFAVYLISSSFRRCALVKKCGCLFSISEFFNPQNKYFCFKKFCSCCCSCFFFKHISCICSMICCCCYNEKEIEEYIEKVRREQKYNKTKEKAEKAKKAKKEKAKKEEEKKEKEKEKNLKNENDENLISNPKNIEIKIYNELINTKNNDMNETY